MCMLQIKTWKHFGCIQEQHSRDVIVLWYYNHLLLKTSKNAVDCDYSRVQERGVEI